MPFQYICFIKDIQYTWILQSQQTSPSVGNTAQRQIFIVLNKSDRAFWNVKTAYKHFS